MAVDVLLIGASSLVRRRVLPALLTLERVGSIHVASRKPLEASLVPPDRLGGCWQSYNEALRECPPCLAYVSLPNAMHAEWARAALAGGFHVIVDKPAFTADFTQAKALADLARRDSLVLAEADVWPWHPLAQQARAAAYNGGLTPRAVIATFTSPAMDPGDFRYQKGLGGGALLDRGSYAASCGRFFFSEAPIAVSCAILGHSEEAGVDTSFSAVLQYPGGVLLGYFSLECEYQNRVDIICGSVAFSVDRVFTPPADYAGSIRMRSQNRVSQVDVPAADSFAAFFDDVLDAIEQRDCCRHSSLLLEDAMVLARMVRSAVGGTHDD